MINPSVCAFPSNRTAITHSHNQQYQLHTTQKWIHRECKHEQSTLQQKENGCSMWTQFMNSNEELDKWHRVDRIHYYLDYSMKNQPAEYSYFHLSLFICDGSGDIEHHSRHSDEVDEKASIICANAIRVVQIQIYLDPWMLSDKSIYLSQMNTLESCRWPIDRYLRYGEW